MKSKRVVNIHFSMSMMAYRGSVFEGVKAPIVVTLNKKISRRILSSNINFTFTQKNKQEVKIKNANTTKIRVKKEIKKDPVYDLDQFFTKSDVALQCIEEVKSVCNFESFDSIIEPSAGTGNFFNKLPQNKRIAVELDDMLCSNNPEYLHKSFFDYIFSDKNKNVLVIGNPPFGTQNKLSVDFFNHAANFANTIAFIIPRTWNKKSVQDRLHEKFHLVKSIDLPEDCFEGNKNTSVKCCFQIWNRSTESRIKQEKSLSHKDWNFLPYVKTKTDLFPPEKANFVVLAYGSNPGQVSTDLYKWRPKSVHFIQTNIDVEVLKNRFSKLDYSCANNSARQSSLCKSDLVRLYTEKYGD